MIAFETDEIVAMQSVKLLQVMEHTVQSMRRSNISTSVVSLCPISDFVKVLIMLPKSSVSARLSELSKVTLTRVWEKNELKVMLALPRYCVRLNGFLALYFCFVSIVVFLSTSSLASIEFVFLFFPLGIEHHCSS